jgi:hypothetical protein
MQEEPSKFKLFSKIGVIVIFSLSFLATIINLFFFVGSFFGNNNTSSILVSVGNFLSNIYVYLFFFIISIVGIIGYFKEKHEFEEVVSI